MTAAFVGIIMLDTVFPRIKGDIGNPESFKFPVQYRIVTGASPERIVINPDPKLIQPMINAGKEMIQEGACAIATSCGFLALFHKELEQALSVPVFTSSLLQVPEAFRPLEKEQKVGVITAREQSLTTAHLKGVGIDHLPMVIKGMDQSKEFTEVFIQGKTSLNQNQCCKEMEIVARDLVHSHPEVGSIVLECTNMPPYSRMIRDVTGLPVYDVLTLLNRAWSATGP